MLMCVKESGNEHLIFPSSFPGPKCVRIELYDACKLVSRVRSVWVHLGRIHRLFAFSLFNPQVWHYWTALFHVNKPFVLFNQPAPVTLLDRRESLAITRAASVHAKRVWPAWPAIGVPEATSRVVPTLHLASVSFLSLSISQTLWQFFNYRTSSHQYEYASEHRAGSLLQRSNRSQTKVKGWWVNLPPTSSPLPANSEVNFRIKVFLSLITKVIKKFSFRFCSSDS